LLQTSFVLKIIHFHGSRLRAVNAKDQNFSLNKPGDRIKRLDEEDDNRNRSLSNNNLLNKIASCKERKQRYETYRGHLEKTGESQIFLTDSDAHLMKQNEGFGVCYNTQTAVDAESRLISGFEVTNHPTATVL
jgi:transposase